MTLRGLYDILKSLAAISGIVAFFGLGYTFYKDYSLLKQQALVSQARETREWAKVTIFSVLHSQGPMELDELLTEYQKKGLPDAAISRSDLSQDALIRTVLELYGSGIVVLDHQGRISIDLIPKDPFLDFTLEERRKYEESEIRGAIGAILRSAPMNISKGELASRVSKLSGSKFERVEQLIDSDLELGLLREDNGSIFIPSDFPPRMEQ